MLILFEVLIDLAKHLVGIIKHREISRISAHYSVSSLVSSTFLDETVIMAAEKPITSQVETQMEDNQKFSTANGDVGLKMFDDYGALASPIDEKAERRLVRKLDMFIIPFICVTYLITYIDKATLSYGMRSPFIYLFQTVLKEFKLQSSVLRRMST